MLQRARCRPNLSGDRFPQELNGHFGWMTLIVARKDLS